MDEYECKICHATDVSLYQANHKELGGVLICQPCWVKCFSKNMMVSGTSGGSGGCGPGCSCS